MIDNDSLAVLALLVGGGLAGGFLIGRHLRGMRALLTWALWLALPFIALVFILAVQIDPRWTSQQASYNFSMGFVLLAIVIAVPWLPANLIGGLIGLLRRKPAAVPAGAGGVLVRPSQAGLPDWSVADSPKLSLADLGERMRGLAERAGTDPTWLPHVLPSPIEEGLFLDRDKFDYIYFEIERGHVMFEHRSVIADELLYRVFVDQARFLAKGRLGQGDISEPDYAGKLAIEQQAILAQLDPAWGSQFAQVRASR